MPRVGTLLLVRSIDDGEDNTPEELLPITRSTAVLHWSPLHILAQMYREWQSYATK